MKTLIQQLQDLFIYNEGTYNFSSLIDEKVYLIEATIKEGFPMGITVSIDGEDSDEAHEELKTPFHYLVHRAFKTLNK